MFVISEKNKYPALVSECEIVMPYDLLVLILLGDLATVIQIKENAI